MIEHCDLNIRYKQFILFLYTMSLQNSENSQKQEERKWRSMKLLEILTVVSFFSDSSDGGSECFSPQRLSLGREMLLSPTEPSGESAAGLVGRY